jgi:hypothetical protein
MQEPFTQAQLEQIGTEVQRASKRVRDRALVGFIILLIGIGVVYNVGQHHTAEQRKEVRNQATAQARAVAQSGRAVAVEGCNRDFNTMSALRASYSSAQALTEAAGKRGEITPRQLETARKFYSDQLAKLTLPDCRLAARILTTNPKTPVQVPTPLYPGMPTVTFDVRPGN